MSRSPNHRPGLAPVSDRLRAALDALRAGRPVLLSDDADREDEADIGHIKLARDADLVVVAPATANLMAKMAGGHADDLASTVLLATTQGDDKVTLVAGISKQLQERGLSAGKWIGPVAQAVGGGGGGRPDLAQAGGKDPAKLPAALEVANKTIAEMLKA